MEKIVNNLTKKILLFLCFFIPFRELIALYTVNIIKFIPDILIWGLLILIAIKNRFKLKLKPYDIAFIGFVGVGLISCILNSVSLMAYALQVRSIGTMYVLFYILRNVKIENKTYKNITNILMSVNIFLILLSIIEFFSDKLILFPKIWADSIIYASNFERTYSLMNNPNTFAMFTFMIMLLVYFINKDNSKKKIFLYYVLAFIGIILSASRSTILLLMLFILFLVYESIKKKSFYNVIHLLVLFVFGLMITYSFELIKNNKFFETPSVNNNPPINENKPVQEPEVQKPEVQEPEVQKPEVQEPEVQKPEVQEPEVQKPEVQEPEEKPKNESLAIIDRFKETTSGVTTDNSKFNGRLFIIKQGLKIFEKYPIIGTGFGTYGSAASRMITPSIYKEYKIQEGFYSDNEYIKVIVESGIIGTIFFIVFILCLLYEYIKEKSIYKIFMLFSFLFIGLFYNVFELQVLCLILYISLNFFENDFLKKEINNKKISILSLHLGYGGVEQVVANTANMLSTNYEVEIISLYKNPEKTPFKINKSVKITYLTNFISNKEEFKNAIKEKNILKILKEGLKATYILLNKNNFMRTAIAESDAKTIISSRYSFSKILNYNGRNNIYKIHHEHTYSTSNEYIIKLNKLKNIDYIIPVSEALYQKYKDRVDAKLILIPNALNYMPDNKELSKLNTKNLIAIGRCVEEKGFMDLLSVIKEINDKEVTLNLFGDGEQLNYLKSKAKELEIEKQVTFWGFKNQEFIKEYMKNSALYVMTSFEESFGLVIIEAMSYGLPCVSFDTAEGAKCIINNKNGYLIKRNVSKMADTIRKYLNADKNIKLDMGKNARKTSEEYKYEKIQKEWLAFIDEILEEN